MNSKTQRFARILTSAALSLALATPAFAGHGRGHGDKWRRYDGYSAPAYVTRTCAAPRVYVHESSCGAPVLAGFVGGLILGAAVHAQYTPAYYAPPPPPPPSYYYYDPYCDVRYGSFDSCQPHFHGCDHPRVIQVISVSSGDCVGTYYWGQGRWHHHDDEDNDRD